MVLARDRKPCEGWSEALAATAQDSVKDELLLEGVPVDELEEGGWNLVNRRRPQPDEVWLVALDPVLGAEIEKAGPA